LGSIAVLSLTTDAHIKVQEPDAIVVMLLLCCPELRGRDKIQLSNTVFSGGTSEKRDVNELNKL
jgi:hypothetical protein